MTAPARDILLTTAPLVPPPPAIYGGTAGGVLDFLRRGPRVRRARMASSGIDYEAHHRTWPSHQL